MIFLDILESSPSIANHLKVPNRPEISTIFYTFNQSRSQIILKVADLEFIPADPTTVIDNAAKSRAKFGSISDIAACSITWHLLAALCVRGFIFALRREIGRGIIRWNFDTLSIFAVEPSFLSGLLDANIPTWQTYSPPIKCLLHQRNESDNS